MNVREEREMVHLSDVESIFYGCSAALLETVICDYSVITVGHSVITVCQMPVHTETFHVCC